MKIKEMYVGFTDTIYVGRFSFFIILDEHGLETELEDIIVKAEHFDNVVISGDEIFKQKKELIMLINKLQERNLDGDIQLYTTGIIKPTGLKDLSNLSFFVNLQLKNTNIKYDDRIKMDELLWFIEAKSKFIFNIQCNDDLDEAGMIVKELNIKRKYVYLLIDTNNKEIINFIKNKAKMLGVNYAIKVNKLLEEENGTTTM